MKALVQRHPASRSLAARCDHAHGRGGTIALRLGGRPAPIGKAIARRMPPASSCMSTAQPGRTSSPQRLAGRLLAWQSSCPSPTGLIAKAEVTVGGLAGPTGPPQPRGGSTLPPRPVTVAWRKGRRAWAHAGVCRRPGRSSPSRRPAVSTATAACPGGATLWLNARPHAIRLAACGDCCTAARIQRCHVRDETAVGSPKRKR